MAWRSSAMGKECFDKKIVMSETSGIESLEPIAHEFMRSIFALEPGDYLLTDESDLRDFCSYADRTKALTDLYQRVRECYLLESVPNKLLDLLRLLQHRTRQ